MGLREQILSATNLDDVNALLKQGTSYAWASIKTRNAWFNAANKKRVEFGQQAEVRKVEKKAERKDPKPPKKKKHG